MKLFVARKTYSSEDWSSKDHILAFNFFFFSLEKPNERYDPMGRNEVLTILARKATYYYCKIEAAEKALVRERCKGQDIQPP